MKTILTLFGILSFVLGLIWRYRLNRYDFRNRVSSERYMYKGRGVTRDTVEHKSYASGLWHKLSKGLGDLLILGGLLVGLYGYFLYDPYYNDRPSNWNSMTSDQKREWKYYHDNPNAHREKYKLSDLYLHELLEGKNFKDWAKQLEKETGLSHLYWRDIADSTNLHTSFDEQIKLMEEGHYSRAKLKSIKYSYEEDPNDPYVLQHKRLELERKRIADQKKKRNPQKLD